MFGFVVPASARIIPHGFGNNDAIRFLPSEIPADNSVITSVLDKLKNYNHADVIFFLHDLIHPYFQNSLASFPEEERPAVLFAILTNFHNVCVHLKRISPTLATKLNFFHSEIKNLIKQLFSTIDSDSKAQINNALEHEYSLELDLRTLSSATQKAIHKFLLDNFLYAAKFLLDEPYKNTLQLFLNDNQASLYANLEDGVAATIIQTLYSNVSTQLSAPIPENSVQSSNLLEQQTLFSFIPVCAHQILDTLLPPDQSYNSLMESERRKSLLVSDSLEEVLQRPPLNGQALDLTDNAFKLALTAETNLIQQIYALVKKEFKFTEKNDHLNQYALVHPGMINTMFIDLLKIKNNTRFYQRNRRQVIDSCLNAILDHKRNLSPMVKDAKHFYAVSVLVTQAGNNENFYAKGTKYLLRNFDKLDAKSKILVLHALLKHQHASKKTDPQISNCIRSIFSAENPIALHADFDFSNLGIGHLTLHGIIKQHNQFLSRRRWDNPFGLRKSSETIDIKLLDAIVLPTKLEAARKHIIDARNIARDSNFAQDHSGLCSELQRKLNRELQRLEHSFTKLDHWNSQSEKSLGDKLRYLKEVREEALRKLNPLDFAALEKVQLRYLQLNEQEIKYTALAENSNALSIYNALFRRLDILLGTSHIIAEHGNVSNQFKATPTSIYTLDGTYISGKTAANLEDAVTTILSCSTDYYRESMNRDYKSLGLPFSETADFLRRLLLEFMHTFHNNFDCIDPSELNRLTNDLFKIFRNVFKTIQIENLAQHVPNQSELIKQCMTALLQEDALKDCRYHLKDKSLIPNTITLEAILRLRRKATVANAPAINASQTDAVLGNETLHSMEETIAAQARIISALSRDVRDLETEKEKAKAKISTLEKEIKSVIAGADTAEETSARITGRVSVLEHDIKAMKRVTAEIDGRVATIEEHQERERELQEALMQKRAGSRIMTPRSPAKKTGVSKTPKYVEALLELIRNEREGTTLIKAFRTKLVNNLKCLDETHKSDQTYLANTLAHYQAFEEDIFADLGVFNIITEDNFPVLIRKLAEVFTNPNKPYARKVAAVRHLVKELDSKEVEDLRQRFASPDKKEVKITNEVHKVTAICEVYRGVLFSTENAANILARPYQTIMRYLLTFGEVQKSFVTSCGENPNEEQNATIELLKEIALVLDKLIFLVNDFDRVVNTLIGNEKNRIAALNNDPNISESDKQKFAEEFQKLEHEFNAIQDSMFKASQVTRQTSFTLDNSSPLAQAKKREVAARGGEPATPPLTQNHATGKRVSPPAAPSPM